MPCLWVEKMADMAEGHEAISIGTPSFVLQSVFTDQQRHGLSDRGRSVWEFGTDCAMIGPDDTETTTCETGGFDAPAKLEKEKETAFRIV